MKQPYRIGLTGGIGSGKSTVAAIWATLGAVIIDADALSRATTSAGGSAIPAIVQTFGAQVLTYDGALDRQKMRGLVFSNPEARKKLEAIVHPLVAACITDATAQAKSAQCIVHDIPLLVESSHWRAQLDSIVVIDCSKATQIQRLQQRDQLQTSAIEAVIGAQASRAVRLSAADHVIFNEGIDLKLLRLLIEQISAKFGL